jgi:iron complex transport system ATP-binding protein
MADGDGLRTRDLRLAYDRLVVIEQLSLALPTGKITALVGPNGCGKSTLLRALARLLKPAGGVVFLDGAQVAHMPTRALARKLGILPQSPVAPEGLSVKDLVAQGRYPYQGFLDGWSREDEASVEDAMRATGIADVASRPVETLSGGQRQRAWVAMTLAQRTEYLLLDEPTTYLDMQHQVEVLDLLYELNRERGCTVVMVLHDLNHAARSADHLVALRNGVVYVEGAPSAVVEREMIRAVFGVECHVMPDPLTGAPFCIPIGRHHARPD